LSYSLKHASKLLIILELNFYDREYFIKLIEDQLNMIVATFNFKGILYGIIKNHILFILLT